MGKADRFLMLLGALDLVSGVAALAFGKLAIAFGSLVFAVVMFIVAFWPKAPQG